MVRIKFSKILMNYWMMKMKIQATINKSDFDPRNVIGNSSPTPSIYSCLKDYPFHNLFRIDRWILQTTCSSFILVLRAKTNRWKKSVTIEMRRSSVVREILKFISTNPSVEEWTLIGRKRARKDYFFSLLLYLKNTLELKGMTKTITFCPC